MKYRNDKVAAAVAEWNRTPSPLNLSYCDLTSDDLEQLACDDTVTSRASIVQLTGNPAQQWVDGIHSLARFPKFKGVQLNGCGLGEVEEVGRRLGDGLARCRPFVGIGLGFNELTGAMLAALLERLPFLRSLDLSGNHLADAHELGAALRPLAAMIRLNLGMNDFSDCEALMHGLAGMKRLSHLALYECVFLHDLVPLLALLPINGGNLQSLDIRNCEAWDQRWRDDLKVSGRDGLYSVVEGLMEIAVQWERCASAGVVAPPTPGSRAQLT